MKNRSVTSSSTRGILRDYSDALGQQLFFWGRDVIHSEGNLLCEYGLERRKSDGLTGTSCYRMPYKGDTIELHGACVGLYSKDAPSFLYIRNRKRCFLYEAPEPPVPGSYLGDNLKDEPLNQLQTASQKFLKWWLEYETWISEVTTSSYRDNCYRAFRKLPQSKSWLPPGLAMEWLRSYAESTEHLRRARVWKNELSTNNKSSV